MLSRKQNPFALIVACLLTLLPTLSLASSTHSETQPLSTSSAGDYQTALIESELVFHGRVIKREFGGSTPLTKEGQTRPIPHTFVTYEVIELIKGHLPAGSRRVTLRLVGGDFAGSRLRVAQMPKIVEGDEDILFIRGNTQIPCPIYHWSEGRIRIVHSMAFTEDSQQLGFNSKGQLRIGASRPSLDISTTDGVYTRMSSRDFIPAPAAIPPETRHPQGMRVITQPTELVHALKAAVRDLRAAGKLPTLPPFINADPQQSFTFRFPRQVPTPPLFSPTLTDGAIAK